MNTNAFIATRDYMHKHLGFIITFFSSAILVLGLTLGFAQVASAQTAVITAQAGPGSSGTHVRNIQAYLAANPTFYPQGLITGYYGPLTQAAVQRFQAFYGIVSSGSPSTTGYGRVGPMTLAKMNSLILGGTSGGGSTTGDVSAPYISGVTVNPSSAGATVTWFTNEPSTDRLYYDTTPIRFFEGDINSDGFLVLSGQSASVSADMATSHSGMISGLVPNTTYYYLIVSKDAAGNVSISLPGATFRTGM